MAVALEGVPLLGVVLFCFLYAFLRATKFTVEPIVSALHSALGWVPFVGNLIQRADNAVIGALNSAIDATEEAISTLWAGVVWSFGIFVDETSAALADVANALEHGFGVTIPNGLHTLWSDAQALGHTTGKVVGGIAGDLVAAGKEAALYADKAATHAVTVAARYTDRAVTKAITGLGVELQTIRDDVKAAASSATQALTAAEAPAAAVSSTVTKIVTQTLPADVKALGADILAAEAAVAGELPRLPGIAWDDVEAMLRSNSFGSLAGLLAAIPLVNALVHALAAETGLTDAECRSKVKGICGTDPQRWAHLLAGLTFAFAWPGLDEFANACLDATEEVAGVITEFVGLG